MDVRHCHLAFMEICNADRVKNGRRGVDLNYLFFRQQVERVRAVTAATAAARRAHAGMARGYERMIERATECRVTFMPR